MEPGGESKNACGPAAITPTELTTEVPVDILVLLLCGRDGRVDGEEYGDYDCAMGQVLGTLRGGTYYTTRYDAEGEICEATDLVLKFVKARTSKTDLEAAVAEIVAAKAWPADWVKWEAEFNKRAQEAVKNSLFVYSRKRQNRAPHRAFVQHMTRGALDGTGRAHAFVHAQQGHCVSVETTRARQATLLWEHAPPCGTHRIIHAVRVDVRVHVIMRPVEQLQHVVRKERVPDTRNVLVDHSDVTEVRIELGLEGGGNAHRGD